jgi:hypothetical protein
MTASNSIATVTAHDIENDKDDDSRTTTHGESTSTESDETAHEGPKSESDKSERAIDKTKVATPQAARAIRNGPGVSTSLELKRSSSTVYSLSHFP